jgi:hypothetical protein
MPMIVRVDGLLFRQPPDWIGTLGVGCCLDAFTSIEALQPEVESVKRTQELAEFFPRVLAPIYDDRRRAFALTDSSVYRSALQVESILTGPGTWKIGGAKISYRHTGLYFLDELGISLPDRHLRRGRLDIQRRPDRAADPGQGEEVSKAGRYARRYAGAVSAV